ncbi:MAG: hypothetical protein F6K42_33165 [Leptolyngbya sp. SIO1D8]|nr:hypothetical protein [Leptolyngbya sp. SIO1D8]
MTAVAALRDQWQADRQMRQQEVAQRRQATQADLQQCQQVRQQKADELWQELGQARQQRETQSRVTADKLKEFDAELKETVADLRDQNRQQMKGVQKYVAELQEATKQELSQHQRDRAVMGNQQEKKLAKYVDELESCVSDYLDEVAEKRQTTAAQDNAKRRQDRELLTHEVDALRDDYAVYRQQMKAFRSDLRQSVWGDTPPETAPSAPTSTQSVASSNGKLSKPIDKPATSLSPEKQAIPSSQTTTPVAGSGVSAEEIVYGYLQAQPQGARLTEIETHLGINRFQAVDALRSLIQKELIVQKDRIYHIREEAVL